MDADKKPGKIYTQMLSMAITLINEYSWVYSFFHLLIASE